MEDKAMAVTRKAAVYTEKKDIVEFVGNPLISALPASVSQNVVLKELLKLPPTREDDRNAEAMIRLDLLSRINTVHVPRVQDLFIARSLNRCICWGYTSRNPVPFSVTAEIMDRQGISVTDELQNYITRTDFPIYGFSVLGISGVGKSSSVLNALKRYTQVIEHTEYNGHPFHCTQIVWLKVDCPGDASQKGLCTAILRQIDIVMGTHYSSEITSRVSKDLLTAKVSQCLCSYSVGVLVVDDIQNLCGAKKDTTSDLLSFLIYLMETLAIPVVMVGTPKVLPLFQQEFQLARRATGDGTVRMELMKKSDNDWQRYLSYIWKYQYLRHPVPLTPEMNEAFFRESVGNPFLCSLLYKLVQDDAITSKEESFSVEDVKKVADEKLCITTIMRANMLNGKDEELRRYEFLWAAADMPIEDPGNIEKTTARQRGLQNTDDEVINYIATKLMMEFKIPMDVALKLGHEAVAAKGRKDRETALGFAVMLYDAAFSNQTDGSGPNPQDTQKKQLE